jgi:hypothetical protein
LCAHCADPRKYAEIRGWHRSKFESILQIYKFDEMDVNVDYSCSIGGDENRKRLSLASDTLSVLYLVVGVIVTHDNCAVFPNIKGGFAIIHSTVKHK